MFSCGVWRVPPVVVENGVIVAVEIQCPTIVSSRILSISELEKLGYWQASEWAEGAQVSEVHQQLAKELGQIGKEVQDKVQ